MSTLAVGNIHLEATGNTRIQYNASNGFFLYTAGAVIATANATGLFANVFGLNVGTTAQRPTGITGLVRFNSNTDSFEGYHRLSWKPMSNPSLGSNSFIRTNLFRIAESIDVVDNYIAVTANMTDDRLTFEGYNFVNGDVIQFTTPNTLPTGISGNTNYYVINTTNSSVFCVSATEAGANVNITANGGNVFCHRVINGMTTGPIEVANGFTITVYPGCNWSVV